MPIDHMRYDILVQQALRGMVRGVLADIAKNGLAGDHHFFISFNTRAEDVRISERLLAQYPKEMTVVLQHQFWDLKVTGDAFEIGLSFGGVGERLYVPFDAIKCFADPSVQFTLQFESLEETSNVEPAEPNVKKSKDQQHDQPKSKSRKSAREEPSRTSVPASPLAKSAKLDSENPPDPPHAGPSGKTSAEVVRFDRFRKK